jgi:hypothetical protein
MRPQGAEEAHREAARPWVRSSDGIRPWRRWV